MRASIVGADGLRFGETLHHGPAKPAGSPAQAGGRDPLAAEAGVGRSGGHLHPFVTLSLALTTLAATASGPAASGLEPGAPGYRLPWNRPTRDSVLDLMPGDLVDRFEFRGRLVSNDDRPVAGLLVYAYHADRQGEYGSQKYPTITTMAGCVRTGPGGGFVVRTFVPGMYEGPPHMHFEVSLPNRGRMVWFVNFRPDSATRTLPNSMNLGAATHGEYDEHFAIVHRDPDGVYRTGPRTLHVEGWFSQPGLDSLHTLTEKRYERAPWRSAAAKRP